MTSREDSEHISALPEQDGCGSSVLYCNSSYSAMAATGSKGGPFDAEFNEDAKVDLNHDIIELSEGICYGHAGAAGFFKSPYVFGAAFLASLGGFSYGYDQGVISLILVTPQFRRQYPECDPSSPHYGFNVGLMTAMLLLGAFVGCLLFPYVADRLSRKWALTISVLFFDVGAVIQTTAPSYTALVAGRAIGGVGVGTLAMGSPLYISEVSPPEMRGSLLVLEELTIAVGAAVAYWVTYGTKELPGDASFRIPFGLQMVMATILGVGIHFFPYSPRWLVMVDRHDESLKALGRLRRRPLDDSLVQREWRAIIAEVAFQNELKEQLHPGKSGVSLELLRWSDLFRKDTRKRTLAASGICFFTQFCGYNAFVYYAPTLFTSIGQSSHNSIILAGLINVVCFGGIFVTMIFMDSIGRRPLAIGGAFGMGVATSIIAALYAQYGNSWEKHVLAGWVCVAFVYVYTFIFGLTYGPLIWCMPSELFQNAHRAKGVGFSVCVAWLGNFVIGLIIPPMIENIKYGTFVFFAVFCGLGVVFSYFCVPETANKTLEQLDGILR